MERKSFSGKLWKDTVYESNLEEIKKELFDNRNLKTEKEKESFLFPSLSSLYNPFEMNGMDKAVDRILNAIKNKERIIIYGDFDTDGITSTVILVHGLTSLGGLISYRIPERKTDSHGLKKHILKEVSKKGVKLVITCDCGINDVEEMNYSNELGMDIIISDHHEPDEDIKKRPAVAILNPLTKECSYPEKTLSGAGVAFKIIQALYEKTKKNPDLLEKYLEIAAIGLVGDCVPITGETRIITKIGLEKIKNSQWEGLKKMLENTNVDLRTIDEQTVGFAIAPRLNASSRMGDVRIATQLFLGDSNKFDSLLFHLEELNEQRKVITQDSFLSSQVQIRKDAPFQILRDDSWDAGILGLIASRHTENLNVPVVACTVRDDGKLSASCRAPEGYSMISALQSVPTLFKQFGGHDGAAGFLSTPEQFDEIKKSLDKYFENEKYTPKDFQTDCSLSSEMLDFSLVDFLRELSPFGTGNQEPIFQANGARITYFKAVGKLKNHLKLVIDYEGKEFNLIAFFADHFFEYLAIGKHIDVLFTLSDSYWNDERKLEMRIVDIRQTV